jgi:putative membrane protein
MKKIFIFGFLLSLSIFGFSGCGGDGDRASNLNTTNMNRPYLDTNGQSNSFSSTADPNNNKSDANANMPGSPNRGTGMTDSDFMTEAAIGGMAEVESGKLASTKAQNAEVKKFAQMMVTDHTKANNELKTLAESKGATLPTELDAKHKSTMTELQGLSGAQFDRAYVAAQLAAHEKTVKLFQTQAMSGTDAEIKAFATKNLPALQSHLEMVRNLNNKMNSGGGNAGGNSNGGGNMKNMK